MKRAVDLRRALVAASATSGAGTGGRGYPLPVREAVVEYTGARRAAGASYEDVAAELGVTAVTLSRWMAETKGVPFRRVEVSAVDDLDDASQRVVVHGPGGLRVEGLTLAGVADLWRRLA